MQPIATTAQPIAAASVTAASVSPAPKPIPGAMHMAGQNGKNKGGWQGD